MEKLFGRAYESIGDTSGDLILKTRGNIKVQVGSSFVDLIKGGELNSNVEVIRQASSKDNLPDNGLYLVDSVIYAKYGNTVLPLNASENTSYVSYILQENITLEQKIQAQKNIGIYYNTLDDAQKNINNGVAYVLNKGLYILTNAIPDQILTTNTLSEGALKVSTLEATNLIQVGNTIIKENGLSLSDKFVTSINSKEVLSLNLSEFQVKNTLIASAIQDNTKSFQLYTANGQSYLKVNNVICSNSSLEYSPLITNTQYYYSSYNNIILSIKKNTSEIVENATVITYTLVLQTPYEYKQNDILHVEYNNIIYDFIIQNVSSYTVTATLTDSTLDPTIISQKVICYGKPADTTQIGFIIQNNTITYGNDTTKTILGILPTGLDYTNGFYSEAAITKKQILIEPSLSNVTFKKSDNFPKLEDGWNLDKEDNSSNIATTKWVKDNAYKLPVATSTVLGGVMVGDGLNITDTGTLSVVDNWTSKLNSLSSNISSNADEISTLKSQIANLQKAVQDLQDKQSSSTTE